MAKQTQNRRQSSREKKTESVLILCTPSEKDLWFAAFGEGSVSRRIREIVTEAARRELR